MTYHGTGINDSPTITAKAKEAIENGAYLAATLADGGVTVAKAEDTPIGIMIPETEAIPAGEDVTIQIKDIGLAMVGEAVKPGDLLAADEGGKLKKAGDGAFILAVALEEATAADQVIPVQIIKAGKNGSGGAGPDMSQYQKKITATGILKGNGEGEISAATAGEDYTGKVTVDGILKGDGNGNITKAQAGTDYQAAAG